jgi:SPX domain protein involved in polyphosphate accumulation
VVDRTLVSRYERKYWIGDSVANQIRHWISTYMQHDPFSHKAENNRYLISSLYFDNKDMFFYSQTKNAEKNRYKIRVRAYGDSDNDPLFFEVKKKMDQIVRKDRVLINRAEGLSVLNNMSLRDASSDSVASHALNNFIKLTADSYAEPKLRVRYEREAFESRSFDPVRVTFDTGLQTASSPNGEVSTQNGDWVKVPALNKTILEVKYSGSPPPWIRQMLTEFKLVNESVPKYILCVENDSRFSNTIQSRYGTI